MSKTTIKWASHTWNPYTWNCTKVSEGCKNCYAAELAKLRPKNSNGGDFLKYPPAWRETSLGDYRKLKPGDVAFVNSMSDTYSEDVPIAWIQKIHTMAEQKPLVVFLMLTKRPEMALEMAGELKWPDNLWIGTSVEMGKYLYRIDTLLQIPAAGHFLSAEPLLEPLPGLRDYLQRGLGWVIVGAESGGQRRSFDTQLARSIRDMCITANVPFMYKQGSHFMSDRERMLDGRTWDETPFADIAEVVQETYQLKLL